MSRNRSVSVQMFSIIIHTSLPDFNSNRTNFLVPIQIFTPNGRKEDAHATNHKPSATDLTPRPAAPQVKQGQIFYQNLWKGKITL